MERPSGKYFEELDVGCVFRHQLTRTVTEADNLLITTLAMNTQLLHLDEEFCKTHSIAETRLVNSIFTLGTVVGVGVTDVSNGTTVGNLGFKDISFPAPVLIGDTLRAETEVLDKRESASTTTACAPSTRPLSTAPPTATPTAAPMPAAPRWTTRSRPCAASRTCSTPFPTSRSSSPPWWRTRRPG